MVPRGGRVRYVIPEERAAWKNWRKNNPGVAHLPKEQQRSRWLSERTAAVASYESLQAEEIGR